MQARGMIAEVEHPVAGRLKIANSPLKLSRTPGEVRGPAPAFGEDSAAVLREWLGLSEAEIEALVAAEVVRTEGGPDIARYLQA